MKDTREYTNLDRVSKDKLIKLRSVAEDYAIDCLTEYMAANERLKEIESEIYKRGK